MTLSCPVCDNSTGIEAKKETRELSVRGEPFTVEVDYYRCPQCGEEFVLPSKSDPLDAAYRAYRERHKLLQPEEIRAFRHKYGLTQSELASLLGLGGATLSRYETGRLQDETHDTLLRLAMKPESLRELVAASMALDQEKRNTILTSIEASESGASRLEHYLSFGMGTQEPDEFSGYRRFDRDKLLNAVLLFCSGGMIKTKLNKLLFYADFKHFKDYTVSITGTRYARIPFGPAPDNYDLYYPVLIRQHSIALEEIHYPGFHATDDVSGEKFTSLRSADLNVFLESEVETLLCVKRFFKDHSAGQISEYSHEEEGYIHTPTGELISYDYAVDLKLA